MSNSLKLSQEIKQWWFHNEYTLYDWLVDEFGNDKAQEVCEEFTAEVDRIIKLMVNENVSEGLRKKLETPLHTDATHVGNLYNPCFYMYSEEDNAMFCFIDKHWVLCDWSSVDNSKEDNINSMIEIKFNKE